MHTVMRKRSAFMHVYVHSHTNKACTHARKHAHTSTQTQKLENINNHECVSCDIQCRLFIICGHYCGQLVWCWPASHRGLERTTALYVTHPTYAPRADWPNKPAMGRDDLVADWPVVIYCGLEAVITGPMECGVVELHTNSVSYVHTAALTHLIFM